MDGFVKQYKQIQSFGLSTNPLANDFVNKINFPNSDRNIKFNYPASLLSNIQTQSISASAITGPPLDYSGGALAKTGLVYFGPVNHTSILKFNPDDESFSTISGIANAFYPNAICIGNYIFFFANTTAAGVQVFDTLSEKIIITVPYLTNSGAYYGACLADNGLIYVIPSTGTQVQVFDPVSMAMVEQFGTVTGGGGLGGCYHPNGKIYCAPRSSTIMLEIDTIRHTTREVTTPASSGTSRYNGACVSYKEDVYFIPRDTTNILKFTPNPESFTVLASYGSGGSKFAHPHVLVNGDIVAAQFGNSGSLYISTADDSSFTFNDLGNGVMWYNGVMTKKGIIYCPPTGAGSGNFMLKIGSALPFDLDYNFLNNRIRKAST